MGKNAEDQKPSEEFDYSSLYKPNSEIYVIKKDGSKELFNVQRVALDSCYSQQPVLCLLTGGPHLSFHNHLRLHTWRAQSAPTGLGAET